MARKKNTWEMVEVPMKYQELADRRTRSFIQPWSYSNDLSLQILMRSCYLQGAADMAETLIRKEIE